jgi:CRISPR/Cas system-associated endonuclease Cas1
MEPLRAPVVDVLVLRVVNLGIVQERDFTGKDGKTVFEKPGLRRYLEEYDRKMKSRRNVCRVYFLKIKMRWNFHRLKSPYTKVLLIMA